MPEQVLKNVGIWIDGRDLAGVSNSVGVSLEAEAPEKTNFKSGGWRERAEGGLKTSSFSLEGYYDIGEIDAAQFASIGQAGSAMIAPAGELPGNLAYVIPYEAQAWEPGASVGELMGFTFAGEGDGEPHRGSVLDIRETVSASVSTPRQNLGAVPADQHIVAWVHVQVNGGMLDIDLVSAAAQAGGAVADRARRLGISATGLYLLQAPGPITDAYWGLVLTPHGAGPDFDVAVATAFPAQAVSPPVPVTPVTPPTPATHTLLGGLSANTVPDAGELTIDPVTGMAGRINYGILTNDYVLIARDASQPDITSVVLVNDPTQANQLPGFNKFASTVDVGGTDYAVWVSDQSLTSAADFIVDVA